MIEIWNHLVRFCSYQERCRSDVKRKLIALGEPEEKFMMWLKKLEEEKLLDENRFATQFINARFRQKKWGRKKIEAGLKAKNISPTIYQSLLNDLLPVEDCIKQITSLSEKKWKSIKGENIAIRKQKLFRWLMGKGFDSTQIREALDGVEFR